MILLLLLILQLPGTQTPAELARTASQLYLNGQYSEASEIWQELISRMPQRGRIAYNLAASQFMMDSLAAADSSLSMAAGDIGEDSLAAANALTSLALGIQMEDYNAVQNAVNALKSNISDGSSLHSERSGLEAGLNWLENHEPPEDQQNQDQQNQDQQNQDQQDQDQQNQDQQNQDQQNQDQQPQVPPKIEEMTPEQAQAILDLVEDNQEPEDSTGTKKAGYSGGPVW